jgi:hypothetical protein
VKPYPPEQVQANPSKKDHPYFGEKVWVDVVRIQGIPRPADGRAGLRTFALEEVLLGRVPEMAGAKIQFAAPLQHGQARQARLRLVPLARHAPTLQTLAKDGKPPDERLSPPSESMWIPASIRPAAPDVKELSPTFAWTSPSASPRAPSTRHRLRTSGLRLVLRRPWFSTGEGERVGIVLWPPRVLNLPFTKPDLPHNELDEAPPEELKLITEEDLGPLGSFVSVWGIDPIRRAPAAADRHRFLSWSDFRLPDDAVKHPRVLLPIPGADPGSDTEKIVEVAVLSFALKFAIDAIDAYVDLDLAPIPDVADPLIRLGVVRIQLNARPDAPPSGRPDRPGIRCSPPVSVQSQLLPARRLSVTTTPLGRQHGADGDQTSISVVLSGLARPAANLSDTRICIELRERIRGEEIAVPTVGGDHAIAEWVGKPGDKLRRDDNGGEAAWSAAFLLPGKLAGRDIFASAREEALMVSVDDNLTAPAVLPRFFGSIALTEARSR